MREKSGQFEGKIQLAHLLPRLCLLFTLSIALYLYLFISLFSHLERHLRFFRYYVLDSLLMSFLSDFDYLCLYYYQDYGKEAPYPTI